MGVIDGNNNQVTININDQIPPSNVATIDKDGKIGNAVSKEKFQESFDAKSTDLDKKIEAIEKQVVSNFKGTLKPSSPTPTEDGSYKPEISSELDKPTDPNSSVDWGAKYPNAGDLRAKQGYETMFYKKGTVWTKTETKLAEIKYNNSTLNPSSIDKAETGKTISEYFKSQEIFPDQTTFLAQQTVNYFDKNSQSIGYLNQGVFSANPSYLTSDYIKCTPNDVIRSRYINWAVYDENKLLIDYDTIPGEGNEFVIANNPLIKFVRVDAPISYSAELMVVKNIPYPSLYVPFGENKIIYKDAAFEQLINETIGIYIEENKGDYFVEKHINLLDTSKLIDGYFNPDGSINPSSAARLTDYIPVIPRKTYIAPGGWDSGYFDSNKENFQLIGGTGGTFLIPPGVYFLRIAIPATALTPTSMIIEASEDPIDFVPFNKASIISDLSTDQLRAFNSPIRNKKWANIGDSIANFTAGYRMMIPILSDCEMLNYAVDGASYAPKSGQTMVISSEYVNIAADADIITVHAGVNDVSGGIAIGTNSDTTNTTFKGALNLTYKGLINKFPGKKIGIITPIQREGNNLLLPYVEAIKEIAKIYGLPVLDLNSNCGLCPDIPAIKAAFFDNIGLHPTRAGHKVFVNKILTFLESL